jgi:hypothetical protein
MSAIAVQGAVGNIGNKATTQLSWFNFNAIGVINGTAIGSSDEGIFLLNIGNLENDAEYTRTITLNTSDLGDQSRKTINFVYLEIDGTVGNEITIQVDYDKGRFVKSNSVTLLSGGLQYYRIPLGRRAQGTQITLSLSATGWFRLNKIQANMTKTCARCAWKRWSINGK